MTDSAVIDEAARAAELLAAQQKAIELFDAVSTRGIIAAGVLETEASDAVRDLAAEMFGVDKHWHKRIVRSGINTMSPYDDNPPDRRIADDDIVFLDFGPVFEHMTVGWEADFGRTFVLGDDPVKHQLNADLPRIFHAGRAFFDGRPDITGEQLYDEVCRLTTEAGWTYGGPLAGHLVGEFPHDRIAGDKVTLYVTPGNDQPMRRLDTDGRQCHWILEIHLVDEQRGIGGFYEELLTV